MVDKRISPLLQDLKFLVDRRKLDDDLGQALVQNIAFGRLDDPLVKAMIEEQAQHFRIQEFFNPPSPFLRPEIRERDGDFPLGYDSAGQLIYVPFSLFAPPSLTVGTTSSGKTTKSKWHLVSIAARIPTLCFEFRKANEFASLKPCLKRDANIDLLVIPARQLRWNPFLVPPLVDKWTWARVVTEMFTRVLLLSPRSATLWKVAVDYFFAKDEPFCIFDVYESILATPANAQAKRAIVDALDPILIGCFQMLKCYKGFSVTDIIDARTVVCCSGNAHEEKDLIFNLLTESLFQYQSARGISNPQSGPLLHISCDESSHLVADNSSGVSEMVRICRGLGLSLDLSVQSADVSRSVLSNAVNRYLGLCGSFSDYRTIGSSMGLTTEQVRYMSQTLGSGSWICSLSYKPLRRPFELRIPDFKTPPVRGDLTDLGPLAHKPIVVADRYNDWVPYSQRRIVVTSQKDNQPAPVVPSQSEFSAPDADMVSTTTTEMELTDVEIRFLQICINHQDRTSSEITKMAKVSTTTASTIRNRLDKMELLTEETLSRSSGRGRPSKMLKPSAKAIEAYGNND